VARYAGKKQISEETRIAKGIERGIDLYKREQKEKARTLDRREHAKRQQRDAPETAPAPAPRRQWLPWLLLGLTWAAIGAYWMLDTA
jgi:hypothetical protein